jgi:CxxC motif-containing protein
MVCCMEIEVKCSCCSKGCILKIDEENLVVVGNSCPSGAEYGISEISYLRYKAEQGDEY